MRNQIEIQSCLLQTRMHQMQIQMRYILSINHIVGDKRDSRCTGQTRVGGSSLDGDGVRVVGITTSVNDSDGTVH